MANEKLSPRQKMIGMMYLVLTAMLALQVSSSVLDQFVLINKSLEHSVSLKTEENTLRIARMKTTIQELGNRKEDMNVLAVSQNIQQETKRVMGYIASLKTKLINRAGGVNKKTGFPKGVKNEAAVARLMLNEKQGDQLKKTLNAYVKYLNHKTDAHYLPIALDAKDHEAFKNDPNQARKGFVSLYFDKVPLGAALATLTQFSSDITYAESKALDIMARKVGAEDLRFDSLTPVVKPQSNIVAAGGMYRADLFLAASSSGVDPNMSVNGKSIAVKGGVGKVAFTAPSGNYNTNGLSRRVFKAIINMPGNKKSSFVKDIEYFVAKPVIQVQSVAVQSLYHNCGNELSIQVPSLGADYNPTFKTKGGELIAEGKKGQITIIPKAKEVELEIYSNGSYLDTKVFSIKRIPKPSVVLTSRGAAIDERRGFAAPGPRKIEAKVIAEPGFKDLLPKDARYRVSLWEVSLARGSRPLKTKKIKGQEVDLSEFMPLAKEGDRMVIEIKEVERLNFKGKIEKVRMGSLVHTIVLT